MRGALTRLAALCIAAAIWAPALGAVIVEPSVTLTRESVGVPANGRVDYAYRLAAGSQLVFGVRSTKWQGASVHAWLVDEDNFQRLVAGRPFDSYASDTGPTWRRAPIVFDVPETQVYHVVLDNSEKSSPRTLDVYAYANLNEPSANDDLTKHFYETFYAELGALFEFDDVDIVVTRCGAANAFSTTEIYICRELDDVLTASSAPGVRLFVLMHEMSHIYLRRWGYRTIYRNQFMVDRLAATLIELMGREEIASEAAQWFASRESADEGSAGDPPFTLRKQRARKIVEWLNEDEELDLSWTRRIVFPRMRTSALESMIETRELQARTRESIERELAERRDEREASP